MNDDWVNKLPYEQSAAVSTVRAFLGSIPETVNAISMTLDPRDNEGIHCYVAVTKNDKFLHLNLDDIFTGISFSLIDDVAVDIHVWVGDDWTKKWPGRDKRFIFARYNPELLSKNVFPLYPMTVIDDDSLNYTNSMVLVVVQALLGKTTQSVVAVKIDTNHIDHSLVIHYIVSENYPMTEEEELLTQLIELTKDYITKLLDGNITVTHDISIYIKDGKRPYDEACPVLIPIPSYEECSKAEIEELTEYYPAIFTDVTFSKWSDKIKHFILKTPTINSERYRPAPRQLR